ncbi:MULTISPECIES: ABC transporter ATP-binding protein [unclassified Planococcus (in: firmicutes)]|uniref:ATP-binding cassette domain-containing protein n=1 Tax=unclassified Planococcus (in: firmicutes) TaxID=2662419 RepID=UPI000C79F36B|nr:MULTISPECIES: ABC transporter ATP-binding protein [unclassified Planococcus (in: firmicutes)]PKG44383.1 hypothetical protein CXF66_17605 [Planococcus sp. Urea-trap-24]PKG89699.1 hypothetical protein CXF91_05810 [Planococcus sp. Urea-3u-39]
MTWKVIRNSSKMFILIVKEHPFIALCWVLIPLIFGFLTYPIYDSRKELINFTSQNIDIATSFERFLFGIYPTLLVLLIATITQYLLLLTMRLYEQKLNNKADLLIKNKIWEKVFSLNFQFLENNSLQNKLERSKNFLGEQFLSFISSQTEVIRLLITLLALYSIITEINYLITIIILLSSIPSLIIKVKTEIEVKKHDRKATINGRKANYISSILSSPEPAKEVRIFGFAPFLMPKWKENLDTYLFTRGELRRSEIKVGLMIGVINIVAFSISLFIFIITTENFTESIGSLTITVWAIVAIQRIIFELIFHLQNFTTSSLNAEDLLDFLETNDLSKSQKALADVNWIESIEFKNVCFKYPNSSTNVLQNINLKLRKGEKVAIVGENGSGKSTMMKLILGLYEPTSGEILINNINLKKINIQSLYENTSTVLQNFTKFPLSFKENIELGAIRKGEHVDQEKLSKFIEKVNLTTVIETSPQGWETILGSYKDSSFDLSGGQWSVFALARTIFKKTDLVILDELSSALDPITEVEIFNQYKKLLNEELVLIISHRLGWARYADRILVMKNGEIIETGNHTKLMEDKKEYFSMFSAQSSWYK